METINHSSGIEIFGFSKYNFSEKSKLRTMDFHAHNTLELSYVAAGSLFVEYYDAEGELHSFSLHKNQFAIFAPQCLHRTSVSIGLQSYGVEFLAPGDFLQFLRENSFTSSFPITKVLLDKFKDILILEDTGNVLSTISQFQKYIPKPTQEYADILFDLDIRRLFVQIVSCSEKVKIDKKYNLHINTALQYIKQNFNKDIKSGDVAAFLGLSPFYFQKIFLAATGKKFNFYLNEQRILYAKQLLTSSSHSLGRISSMVGYNNLQNFISNFKRITGMLPTEFRVNNQEHFALIEENLFLSTYEVHHLFEEDEI